MAATGNATPELKSRHYDAIVVGGGHNGLVAAAYLAKSGAKTVVLEGRHKTGGAATTESPWPDAPEFKVTRLSYVMSLLPPTIIKDLELARHGYKIYPMGPYYQAFPEGGAIKLYADDAKRNYESVSQWSKKDADAMPQWDAWLAGLADVLGPLLLTVPPSIGSHKPKDLASTLKLAWRHRGLDVRTVADVTRLMTMSIADLLDDWFESPQVKGALAVNGVIGTWAGPYEPGTAYVMAHHSIGDVGDGHLGNWGFQEGGMGAVSSAIESAACSHGAEVRLNARVARVIVEDGKAAGVLLDNGDEIRANVVVSTLHPRTAFLDQVGRENLPEDFVTDIEHWRTRSGVVKINLALAELPDFTADPGTELQEHHTGSVEMAPTMEYIERAFQDAREGKPALRPFSDGVIPTAFDKTLSPEGTHIMSLFTQWVPADWSEHPHTAELEAYADRMVDCYNELAPNFKASILHRDIVGPYQMEQEYGLIGGNIFHGELSLEQLFHMRPAPGFADYRTPVPGLYYGSSATHAGGGVCGIPGWQAAKAAMADQRKLVTGSQMRKLTRRS
ncbi:MAG TPA: NAD(P)/FAD-dependent oxidoreductase [Streptosporangiaceae bacterium]|nr:NAD(P)/FAD-dependent oxidoreductase [Streptosporangiaceae bacterium]